MNTFLHGVAVLVVGVNGWQWLSSGHDLSRLTQFSLALQALRQNAARTAAASDTADQQYQQQHTDDYGHDSKRSCPVWAKCDGHGHASGLQDDVRRARVHAPIRIIARVDVVALLCAICFAVRLRVVTADDITFQTGSGRHRFIDHRRQHY